MHLRRHIGVTGELILSYRREYVVTIRVFFDYYEWGFFEGGND